MYARTHNIRIYRSASQTTSLPYFGVKLSCVCLFLLKGRKVMTYSDPLVTYSHPKITYSYPNVNYSGLKVTYSYPKVTYGDPRMTKVTLK